MVWACAQSVLGNVCSASGLYRRNQSCKGPSWDVLNAEMSLKGCDLQSCTLALVLLWASHVCCSQVPFECPSLTEHGVTQQPAKGLRLGEIGTVVQSYLHQQVLVAHGGDLTPNGIVGKAAGRRLWW